MTTITLMTNDQSLSVVLKPLIASGDYNLVKVQVEFDSAWDRYTVRSAVFRTLKGAEAEVLLIDGECTIPHEVLAEPGTLFIALRGVTYEGDVIKTTEEVKYKIVQGAKDIASTTAPSHDMFAQYCAAIAAGIAPHVQSLNEEVAGKIAEVESTVNAKIEDLQSLAGSFSMFKVGSYPGNNQFGASNAITLSFDFEPKFVVVLGTSASQILMMIRPQSKAYSSVPTGFKANGYEYTYEPCYITWGEDSVSWYCQYYASAQMNSSGTYFYIAFGS